MPHGHDRDDNHDLDQSEGAARWKMNRHCWPMVEVMANIADNTLKSKKPTPSAMTMIIAGS